MKDMPAAQRQQMAAMMEAVMPTVTTQVTQITTDPIPAAKFAPPAGYRKVKFDEFLSPPR